MSIPMLAAPKSKTCRHGAVVTGLILLLLAVAWSFDAWLFARLRIIASDTFASGGGDRPHLFDDDAQELNAYPPHRLIKQLSLGSPQIRSVICLSLANRREEGEPAV